MESKVIIQLTMYLVRIGQDPFTYCFPISVPSNSSATIVKGVEDNNFKGQCVGNVAEKVPESGYEGLVDGVSTPITDLVENRELGCMETEDDVFEDVQKSENGEVRALSPPGLVDVVDRRVTLFIQFQITHTVVTTRGCHRPTTQSNCRPSPCSSCCCLCHF